MTEGKTRFRDISTLTSGVTLKGLGLRPKGAVIDPTLGAVTSVGRLAEATSKSLMAQVEELKAERSAGMVVLRLDPKSIGSTKFANRDARGLTTKDGAFAQLKKSIQAHGQDTPIRVRPAVGGTKDYEIVEGHRRHAAILELDAEIEGGFPILARLDAQAAEAKDLVLKMYRENAEREDLSAFETGMMFSQWLAAGLYKSQGEIGDATGMDRTNVGLYILASLLPAEVLQAFHDPRRIALRWVKDLRRAFDERPKQVIARALRLAKSKSRPDAEAVFRELTSGIGAGKPSRGDKLSESVKVDDKVLFTIALKSGRFTINPKQVDDDALPALYEELKACAHKWLKARRGASK